MDHPRESTVSLQNDFEWSESALRLISLVLYLYNVICISSTQGIPDGKPWLASYTTWKGRRAVCFGKWVRSVCVYGIGDLPALIKNKHLFANKFMLHVDPLAYECMEALIEQRSICPPPFNDTYYRNLRFIIKQN